MSPRPPEVECGRVPMADGLPCLRRDAVRPGRQVPRRVLRHRGDGQVNFNGAFALLGHHGEFLESLSKPSIIVTAGRNATLRQWPDTPSELPDHRPWLLAHPGVLHCQTEEEACGPRRAVLPAG